MNEKGAGYRLRPFTFIQQLVYANVVDSQCVCLRIIMHQDHAAFIDGILHKKKVLLRFYSKEDGNMLNRICAPMDYGPSRRTKDQSNRYHFWDYDSDKERHVLGLGTEQVYSISVSEDVFDPRDFITWDITRSPWFFPRDWGVHS